MATPDELIELCKNGDPLGYTGLYQAYAKQVYNSIYRLLDHSGEAEDVLQETFVAAFQSIHQFNHTGAFGSWIKRIGINKAVTLVRKRKLKWVELEPVDMMTREDEAIDEEDFEYTMDAVTQAIALLPVNYRTVFQLYAVENVPQTEIAKMLGISHNAVRTQYFRAKNKVLNMLKEKALS
ncbi:RNA polymerase sigma-70 factor (ECF subfamily) [Mucilaginibacter gracilis]|uniref:RNA polymerase sigma factor n=1 Tax=Mucilaginibacter gracilis TaxID=423350 RepID=A0A495JAX3_9SPHI|nr:RNA polymerase sigma factor [Mucilaginibacter gracilis]RKR85209.1 RNA polymerase sigma-70 factor (ECF subfamily) [Mucilaginibacter gracilis]